MSIEYDEIEEDDIEEDYGPVPPPPPKFPVECPWCRAINYRSSIYWTFHCFHCRKLFYVNRDMKACRVERDENYHWVYLDEDRESWMN